jgi:molybdopterin converting factor small subunit/proteasome lid subunit RPN8/RPN11
MLTILSRHFHALRAHGEAAYPNEGAGLLLGRVVGMHKTVVDLLPLANQWRAEEQYHRYLIAPQAMMHGEDEAARRGLDVIGVFHSHPDHAEEPSIYDREWALPWYSYIITRVEKGRAILSRGWLLKEDRSAFEEERIENEEWRVERRAWRCNFHSLFSPRSPFQILEGATMATIRIPTPLRPYTGGQAEVGTAGVNVGAALNDLTSQFPTLKGHLYTEGGELRAFVNIFLNEEDIQYGQGLNTPLKDHDRLMIVPSIAGG